MSHGIDCDNAKRLWKVQLQNIEKALVQMKKQKEMLGKPLSELARTSVKNDHLRLGKSIREHMEQLERYKARITRECGSFSFKRKARKSKRKSRKAHKSKRKSRKRKSRKRKSRKRKSRKRKSRKRKSRKRKSRKRKSRK